MCKNFCFSLGRSWNCRYLLTLYRSITWLYYVFVKLNTYQCFVFIYLNFSLCTVIQVINFTIIVCIRSKALKCSFSWSIWFDWLHNWNISSINGLLLISIFNDGNNDGHSLWILIESIFLPSSIFSWCISLLLVTLRMDLSPISGVLDNHIHWHWHCFRICHTHYYSCPPHWHSKACKLLGALALCKPDATLVIWFIAATNGRIPLM